MTEKAKVQFLRAHPNLAKNLKSHTSSSRVTFQYTGQTSLVMRGPKSGRRYVFLKPGAVVDIDPIDERRMSQTPHLRKVVRS